MDDAAKQGFLIKTFQTWEMACQNMIAKTSHHIRWVKLPENELWIPLDAIDVSQKPRGSWQCSFFRINGKFGKTNFATDSFPVGLTHRSRTSCLPSASSNTENFNRLAFWLKSDFENAIHFPFFETQHYKDRLTFDGLSEEGYVVIRFPIESNNKALKVERTMWLDAANGFLPAKMMTSVTRNTRAGESIVFGITLVGQFKSVNGIMVPIELYEYVARPSSRDRTVSFYHTRVDEIKIRRRS